jgi:hydrogenase maturation protease
MNSSAGTVLVIGYGNELRGDDAAGPKLAAAVTAANWNGVQALACHQLTPELAEEIAAARLVIFVDAAYETGQEVRARRLEPSATAGIMAHVADPRGLLSLAQALYGHCPPAWSITIPGASFDFHEQLSPAAERGAAVALDHIKALCSAGTARPLCHAERGVSTNQG